MYDDLRVIGAWLGGRIIDINPEVTSLAASRTSGRVTEPILQTTTYNVSDVVESRTERHQVVITAERKQKSGERREDASRGYMTIY